MRTMVIAVAVVLFGLVSVSPVAGAALSDGLIGYWGLDGDGRDRSTLGNDLTIFGGAGFAQGLFGQALDLHGDSSQYAAREVDDEIYDFGSSDFTVQAWVNYYSIAGEQTLVEKFAGDAGPGWTFTKLSGNQGHFWSQTSGALWSTPMDLATNEWHQLVVRQTDAQFEILLDTQTVTLGTSTLPIPDTTTPLLIGRRGGGQQFPTNGRIDEVATWNRALSDAEIAYLYNGGAGNPVLPPPEPVTRRVPADYSTIQAAIDASLDGDTVLVAPGEYVITEPITFRGKAITVRGDAGPEVTTIRMAETPTDPARGSVVVFENRETNAAVLSGVTITGGKARFMWGGGVCCWNSSSPMLINCTISGNSTGYSGGGIVCYGASSPTIINCTISANSTGGSGGGGGVCCWESSPTLMGCLIKENTADGGGGVYCYYSAPTLTDCAIVGNTAAGGGGVHCWRGSPTLRLTNCIISGNTANVGSGMCSDGSPTVCNCTFSGNTTTAGGTPLYCNRSSSPKFTNCIIWGNDGEAIKRFDDTSTPVVTYSCIQGTDIWTGTGNINADPLFLGGDDFHLQRGSPCIDTGTSDSAPATDIEGNARPCGAAVDMGAYEYCPFFQLALSSAHVAECAPARVFVNLANDEPIQAFSLGVAHDPAIATLTAIDFVDCPSVQALNGNEGPDYFGVDLKAGTENCAPDIAAGGTVYCIASQGQPSTITIPAGTDQPIARLTYEALPENVVGTESLISIVGCLGGELPRDVVLTVDGLSVFPTVAGGILTVDAAACRFKRGDANGDGRLDISDAVTILIYLFEDGRGPLRCQDAGDANDDGALDIGDAVRILGRLFAHGMAFDPPYPTCGTDPTLDALRCGMSACE